jgi:hypothetical protein
MSMADNDTLANNSKCFIEIRPLPSKAKVPDRIEVYISRVQPQQCSALLKDLQQHFGSKEDVLSHLKHVRRSCTVPPADDGTPPPPVKKSNTGNNNSPAVVLEVLLGLVIEHEHRWSFLEKKYSLHLEKRWLPGRPAESEEEREEFNKEWPTIYFHKKSLQHQQQELELTDAEIAAMREGMQHAIDDAIRARESCRPSSSVSSIRRVSGAVIACPTSGCVVARANDERRMQQQSNTAGMPNVRNNNNNPLCTSTLLAIQGVSRKERASAVGHGMNSDAFQKGQYLCTGYVSFFNALCDSFSFPQVCFVVQ